MDRFFASRVSSSSNAAQSARQLSSIDDVRRWLTTLTEVTSTQKLESLRAAVNVLKTPKLRQIGLLLDAMMLIYVTDCLLLVPNCFLHSRLKNYSSSSSLASS